MSNSSPDEDREGSLEFAYFIPVKFHIIHSLMLELNLIKRLRFTGTISTALSSCKDLNA